MTLQPWLVEILVCPESGKRLLYFEEEQFLFCPESKRRYRIDDGIPVLLPEEAEELTDEQVAELVTQAKSRGLID